MYRARRLAQRHSRVVPGYAVWRLIDTRICGLRSMVRRGGLESAMDA
jgi:hypothetical protein